MAETYHLAENRHSGRLERDGLGLGGDVHECAGDGFLVAGARPAHEGDGSFRWHSFLTESGGDGAQPLDAHEHDLRAGGGRQRLVVEGGVGLGRILVSRENREHRSVFAMGHWNARIGRTGDRGADAWDDLEPASRRRQSLGLLAASAENKRVATLKSRDGFSGLGFRDEEFGDFLLTHRVRAGLFADIEFLGVGGRPFQKLGIAEIVVDHDIRAFEALAAFECE